MNLFFAVLAGGLPAFDIALLSHARRRLRRRRADPHETLHSLLPWSQMGLLRWSMMLLHLHEIQGNTGVQTRAVNWIAHSPGDAPSLIIIDPNNGRWGADAWFSLIIIDPNN